MPDALQVAVEGGDKQNAFEDTDDEEGDEADACGDAEIRTGDQQGEDAAYDRRGDVQKDQSRVLEVAEHREEQQEDEQETHRDNLRQSFGGALLVLEIALPDHAV